MLGKSTAGEGILPAWCERLGVISAF